MGLNKGENFADLANNKFSNPEAMPTHPGQAQPQPVGGPTAGLTAALNAGTAQPQGGYTPQQPTGPKGILSHLHARSVPRSQMGQRLQAYYNSLKEIAKQEEGLAGSNDWAFHVFDSEKYMTVVSAIIYARRKGSEVVAYPLLVWDPLTELPARQYIDPRDGHSFEVVQTPDELWSSDKHLSGRIQQFVSEMYPGCKLYLLDGTVLVPELEPTNENQLRANLYYANDAVETSLNRLNGTEVLNLAERKPDETLVQRIEFKNPNAANAAGLPVRSDITVKTSIEVRQQNQIINTGMKHSIMFTTVRACLALTYSGASQVVYQQTAMGMVPIAPPPFRPTVAIKYIDTHLDQNTLETRIAGLVSILAVTLNQYWSTVFAPNYAITTPGEDPFDIGALTACIQMPNREVGYTQVKSKDFNLNIYISELISNDPLFAYDIRECGEMSHLDRVFLEAAGIVDGQNVDVASVIANAEAAIIASANNLLGGAFTNRWAPHANEPIVYNDNNRIETGYYISEKGDMRDLSEIDYLWFANKANPDAANEYMDSFNPNFGSEQIRHHMRKRLYDTWLTPSGYQIRGFARRVVFNPNFLVALQAAFRDVVGQVQIQSGINQHQTPERGYRNQIAGINPNDVNLFTVGGYYNGAAGYNNNNWRHFQPRTNVAYMSGGVVINPTPTGGNGNQGNGY